MFLDEIHQPLDARVFLEGVADAAVGPGFFGDQFARDAGKLRQVVLHRERHRAVFALGKASHRRARIAENHPSGAVLVEERAEQPFPGARFPLRQRVEVFAEPPWVAIKDFPQRRVVLRFERLLVDDFFRDRRHRPETLRLRLESRKVVVAVRVEQPEPRKMSRKPELGGRRC